MVIPPLGGAIQSFRRWILKGVTPSLYHASLTYFAYLQPLKSYSTFSFWAGISLLPAKFVGFSEKMTPKKSKFRKKLV